MISSKIGDYRKKLYQGEDVLTKFLDLEEQKELSDSLKREFNVEFFGGYLDSERKRAYLSGDKSTIDNSLFEISIITSKFDKKFSDITHRNVLGTIMALGINRNTFGDIIIENNQIYIFVTKEIKDYLINNLDIILRQRMHWEEVDSYIEEESTDVERIINVASMRLDAVISKGCNKSRNDANELIEHGMVLINHKEELNNSHMVKVGDIISIRKFGRIEIVEMIGVSKKDRINLKVVIKH